MNRLELGKYWLAKLFTTLPDASNRMVTRMAWHLAALSVTSDEELSKTPDVALSEFHGGTKPFLGLRAEYLRRLPLQSALAGQDRPLRQLRRGGRQPMKKGDGSLDGLQPVEVMPVMPGTLNS